MSRSIGACFAVCVGMVLPSSAAVTEAQAAAGLAAAAFDSRELGPGRGRVCTLHTVPKEDAPDVDVRFAATADGVHGQLSVDGATWVAFDPTRVLVIAAGDASDAVTLDAAPVLFARENQAGKVASGFGVNTEEDAEASLFAFNAPAIAAGRRFDPEASDDARLVFPDDEGRLELEQGAE